MDPHSSPNPVSIPAGGVVYLLDAASDFEEGLLREWIAGQRESSDAVEAAPSVRIPSSRRARAGRPDVLEAALAGPADVLLQPLRIAWLAPERDGRREASLRDLLGPGDPRDPGVLRARFIHRFAPDRCHVLVGEPELASALRAQWRDAAGVDRSERTGFASFVTRQAALALDRAERRLRGGRYKIPRFLEEEILERPSFRGGLERLAREHDLPLRRVHKRAERALREIAARPSPLWIDVFARLCRSSSTRGYEQLRVDPDQIAGVRHLTMNHPVVFLPTHKSNLDHPVVFRALHEEGFPPSHTAGGDNMNFFPQGPIARRAGIFFIRRAAENDAVYKLVLRSYVDFLIEKRFPLQWFIEGGRSRSGKLLPPRYGLLAYVVDSYLRGKSDDVFLVPVSVAYDQISEVRDYASEQRGAPKEPEGVGWLFRFLKSLSRRYGSIDLRFGEPVSLRETLGVPGEARDDDALTVPKLAFEVCSRINRVTPVTPTSLAMLAVLGAGDRALTLAEVERALADLAADAKRRALPTTEPLDFAGDEAVRDLLAPLVENGVLECFEEGPEPIYSVARDQHLAAAYYRNTVVHFLTTPAIVELALLRASESEDADADKALWDEALRLRDLLKFEFFFPEREAFGREVRDELALHGLAKGASLADAASARDLLERMRPFHAPLALGSFLEAYALVAGRLAALGGEPVRDEKALARECLGWGQHFVRQRRIRSRESVSKSLLENGLKLAEHRGLLGGDRDDGTLADTRLALARELEDTVRRIDAIRALDSARRAGVLGAAPRPEETR